MRDLRQYASYLGSEGIDVLDADQDVVSGYMNSMKANGKIRRDDLPCAGLHQESVQYPAVQNREIEENPIHNIKIDKAEKKLPQILTGKEVELLLQQPKVTEMKGCRDKAMLEVLAATGIRVSELIGLNIDDVSLPGSFHPRRERREDAHHPDLSGSAAVAARIHRLGPAQDDRRADRAFAVRERLW